MSFFSFTYRYNRYIGHSGIAHSTMGIKRVSFIHFPFARLRFLRHVHEPSSLCVVAAAAVASRFRHRSLVTQSADRSSVQHVCVCVYVSSDTRTSLSTQSPMAKCKTAHVMVTIDFVRHQHKCVDNCSAQFVSCVVVGSSRPNRNWWFLNAGRPQQDDGRDNVKHVVRRR